MEHGEFQLLGKQIGTEVVGGDGGFTHIDHLIRIINLQLLHIIEFIKALTAEILGVFIMTFKLAMELMLDFSSTLVC